MILLTEDRASLALARSAGLAAETFVGYVTREHPSARDLIRFSDTEAADAVPDAFAYKVCV